MVRFVSSVLRHSMIHIIWMFCSYVLHFLSNYFLMFCCYVLDFISNYLGYRWCWDESVLSFIYSRPEVTICINLMRYLDNISYPFSLFISPDCPLASFCCLLNSLRTFSLSTAMCYRQTISLQGCWLY